GPGRGGPGAGPPGGAGGPGLRGGPGVYGMAAPVLELMEERGFVRVGDGEGRPQRPLRLPLWQFLLPLFLLGGAGLASLLVQVASLGLGEGLWGFLLGLFTLLRVLGVLALAALVWVPVGILLGLRPRLAQRT
ncbi:MAG: hypothetical protein ABDH20_08935, partial [Thermus sp.]